MSVTPRELARLKPIWQEKWNLWMSERGFDQERMDKLIQNYPRISSLGARNGDEFRMLQNVLTWTRQFWKQNAKTWADHVTLNVMFLEGTLIAAIKHFGPLYDVSDDRREGMSYLCIKLASITSDSQSSTYDSLNLQREYFEMQIPNEVFHRIRQRFSSLPAWVAFIADDGMTIYTNYMAKDFYMGHPKEPKPFALGLSYDGVHSDNFRINVPLTGTFRDGKWRFFTNTTLLSSDPVGLDYYSPAPEFVGTFHNVLFLDTRWPTATRNFDGELLRALNDVLASSR